MKEEIKSLIEEILNIKFDKENEQLKENGVDSLMLIKIIIGLEEKYNIIFEDNDLYIKKFDTLDDLVACVVKKTDEKYHD